MFVSEPIERIDGLGGIRSYGLRSFYTWDGKRHFYETYWDINDPQDEAERKHRKATDWLTKRRIEMTTNPAKPEIPVDAKTQDASYQQQKDALIHPVIPPAPVVEDEPGAKKKAHAKRKVASKKKPAKKKTLW